MATAQTVIDRALRLIGVAQSGQPASPQEVADGLDALNRMLSSWDAAGISLGYTTIASAGSTMPVPDDALRAVEFNLAVEISPEYERPLNPVVAGIAASEYSALLADSINITEAVQDHLPGVRRRYDINQDH